MDKQESNGAKILSFTDHVQKKRQAEICQAFSYTEWNGLLIVDSNQFEESPCPVCFPQREEVIGKTLDFPLRGETTDGGVDGSDH